MTPRATPLPVRLSTSQFWATVCIQVPVTDTNWPMKNSLKFRTCSERKVRPLGAPTLVLVAIPDMLLSWANYSRRINLRP